MHKCVNMLIAFIFLHLYSALVSEHQNYFGVDENLGPVAVSVRRERLEDNKEGSQYNYRVTFRTSQVSRQTPFTIPFSILSCLGETA